MSFAVNCDACDEERQAAVPDPRIARILRFPPANEWSNGELITLFEAGLYWPVAPLTILTVIKVVRRGHQCAPPLPADFTRRVSMTAAAATTSTTPSTLNLCHPLTGPVYIEGAKRGDAIAVTVVDIAPDDFAYTPVVPGFGFLRDVFPDPYIVHWELNRLEARSKDLPGIAVPNNAFKAR